MAGHCVRQSSSFMLVLTALAVGGCGPSADTDKTRQAPRVTVAHPVVRRLVDEDDYNGWLEAYKKVDVRARVRGHITKVLFNDGDIVKEGQPLFELDAAPFEAELKQVEAQVKALESQKVAADREVDRSRIMLQSKAVSQQEFDKSEASAGSFDAQIAAKKAEVDRRRLDLKYATITADLAGKISKANLTEGNLVNAGGNDPLLTTIVAIDPIYVDFNVDERAMQRYQEIGASHRDKREHPSLREQKLPFTFGLDTEEGFPHQGHIVFADNRYAEGTGTILVRGVAPNPDGRLIPGSRIRVRIPVSDPYEAALVPDTAVLSDQDRRYLLVLGKDDVVLRRDINPGRLLDDGMRVILPTAGEEGATHIEDWEKEWVITLGLQRARIGYPVEPLNSDGQPIHATGAAQ